MPRIPSVEGSARPTPQPVGNVTRIGAGDADSLSAEARVTAQQGGMLMQAGDQLAARQKEFDREVEREQLKVDTLRAEDAMTKLREKQLALSLGENGYTKVQGTAAISRPLLKDYGDLFDQEVKGMMGELGNDQQKELFRQRAQVVNLQYREGILRHLATESRQAQKQQLEGTVAVEIKQATANWDKPDEVGFSIERVRAGINRMAEIDGWDSKYTQAKTKEVLGKIHDSVIDQMISSGQLVRAQDWYKANKEDVDVGTAKTIQAKTVDAQQREVFNGLRASFLAVQDSPQGLKDLMKSVQGAPSLDEAKRNTLVAQIQSQQQTLATRAQTAAIREEARATRAANELTAAIYSGREFTQADIPMLERMAKENPSQAPRINGLIKLNQEMAVFRTMPLEQQLAIVQRDEVGVRDGSVTDKTRDARKAIYESSLKMRGEDPSTWAVQKGVWKPDAPEAQPLDFSNLDKLDPAALKARYDAVRGLAYGAPGYAVPFKPGTSAEVRVATTMLSKMRPEQRMGFLSVLAEKSKGDMEGYRAFLAQIAPDQPAVAKAAVLAIDANADRRKATAADLIAAGQSILEPPSQETGKAGKTALIQQPPEAKLRAKFTEDVRNAYSTSPEEHDATFQTIRAAYAALTKDSNTADRTIIDNDAWKKAVDLATGGIHKYKGRETVLPWGMGAGEWEDKAFTQIKSMERAGKLPPGMSANRLLDLQRIKVGDTKYVLMQDGQPVLSDKVGRDGRPEPLVIDVAAPIEPGARPAVPAGTSPLKRRAAIADQQKFDQQWGAPK